MTDLEKEIQSELDAIIAKKQKRQPKRRGQSLRAARGSKKVYLTNHGIERYIERANARGLTSDLIIPAIIGEISQSEEIGTGKNKKGKVRYLRTVTGLVFVMSEKSELVTVLNA